MGVDGGVDAAVTGLKLMRLVCDIVAKAAMIKLLFLGGMRKKEERERWDEHFVSLIVPLQDDWESLLPYSSKALSVESQKGDDYLWKEHGLITPFWLLEDNSMSCFAELLSDTQAYF